MTVVPFENPNAGTTASAQVWRCNSCHCIHLYIGQVLLTFTQSEFAGFAQEVVECYCVQLPSDNSTDERAHELNLPRLLEDPANLAITQ